MYPSLPQISPYKTINKLDTLLNTIKLCKSSGINDSSIVDKLSISNDVALNIILNHKKLMEDDIINCLVNDVEIVSKNSARYELLDMIKNGINSDNHVVEVCNICPKKYSMIHRIFEERSKLLKNRRDECVYPFIIAGSFATKIAMEYYNCNNIFEEGDIDIFTPIEPSIGKQEFEELFIKDKKKVQIVIKDIDRYLNHVDHSQKSNIDAIRNSHLRYGSYIVHMFDLDCCRFFILPSLDKIFPTSFTLVGTKSSIEAIKKMKFTVNKYMASIPRTFFRVKKYRERGFDISVEDIPCLYSGNINKFYGTDYENDHNNMERYLRYAHGIDHVGKKFVSKQNNKLLYPDHWCIDDTTRSQCNKWDLLLPKPSSSTYKKCQYFIENDMLNIFIDKIDGEKGILYCCISLNLKDKTYRYDVSEIEYNNREGKEVYWIRSTDNFMILNLEKMQI